MRASGVGVHSEVGRLRTVLVHRPDLELERVTPENKDELLFDELLWVDHARDEHDAFTSVLTGEGAQVLHLDALLVDLLEDQELARDLVAGFVTATTCGTQLVDRVRSFLLDLPTTELVRHLIGGVSLEEVAGGRAPGGDGLVGRVHRPFELLLPPLPNAVFMRDSSAWIGDGVVVSPMNRLVRRREAELLRLVYRHHPRFRDAVVWFGDEASESFPATVEGGDVLVTGPESVAIGISERTTVQGVELLASRLFDAGVVERILAVELPRARATMHLDTVVTMVDVDAFLFYPRIRRRVRSLRVTPSPAGGMDVEEANGLRAGLSWLLDRDVRVIEPALGSVEADREQWNDANNVFAIAPGEVVAYERNVTTNTILEDAGVTVHAVPSYELSRGRGGPRCMTCPVLRDPV